MLKKILFPFLSIFLAYRAYELIVALHHHEGLNAIGLNILWAFLLNLFVTGVFAFTGFAYPTHRLLPEAYYRIKNEELLKSCYKLLGVKYFKVLLMLAFWGAKKNRMKYFNGTKSGIQNFNYQTKQSEFGHLVPFVVLFILSLLFAIENKMSLAIFVFSINFIGNLYPIILQRHHRIRTQKLGY